ncbi:hypothetical protein [uncultured Methylobacterium sp.]|uniref:hypothetical protein n=1 Tax=uncultured Methylobacterium sp. TaxID=157278 RepID=UPI00262A9B01|nr:hypothetical protein [uncultured Methylobacterium sp.]
MTIHLPMAIFPDHRDSSFDLTLDGLQQQKRKLSRERLATQFAAAFDQTLVWLREGGFRADFSFDFTDEQQDVVQRMEWPAWRVRRAACRTQHQGGNRGRAGGIVLKKTLNQYFGRTTVAM